jgi:hypothetical protein
VRDFGFVRLRLLAQPSLELVLPDGCLFLLPLLAVLAQLCDLAP